MTISIEGFVGSSQHSKTALVLTYGIYNDLYRMSNWHLIHTKVRNEALENLERQGYEFFY